MLIKLPTSLFINGMKKGDKKFRANNPNFSPCHIIRDINYLGDDNFEHNFDLLYPSDNLNNNHLIINIHGGGYFYGYKEQSEIYCSYFASKGFIVVSPNYSLIKENVTVENQIKEMVCLLLFLDKNKEKYKLNFANLAIMGDSAGGHIAMMVSFIFNYPEIANIYGFKDLPKLNITRLLLSSPMYDYERILKYSLKYISKKGAKSMFSNECFNKNYMKKNSPRTYINKGYKLPRTLLISARGDFFKTQSDTCGMDLLKYQIDHTYYFDCSLPKLPHVFNHFAMQREETKKANLFQIDFILN